MSFTSLLLNLVAFKCRGKKCWNREKSSPQTLDAVAGSDQWLGAGRRKKTPDSSGSLSQWFQGKRLKAEVRWISAPYAFGGRKALWIICERSCLHNFFWLFHNRGERKWRKFVSSIKKLRKRVREWDAKKSLKVKRSIATPPLKQTHTHTNLKKPKAGV